MREWASGRGWALGQVRTPGQTREVAAAVEAEDCALIVALGGDGTTLAALHAGAGAGRPVLGVACGSLGALAAVGAGDVAVALERFANGDWTARHMPALAAGEHHALNDLVLIRDGAGQVAVDVVVDGEVVVRFAGDGLVAATPFGSTAYTLASGGPMLAPGLAGIVLTPLAPHGGVCPPVVVPPDAHVELTLHAGFGGARVEVDGQIRSQVEPFAAVEFKLAYTTAFADLVALPGQESMFAGLRRRRIVIDSPRVLIRDERERSAAKG